MRVLEQARIEAQRLGGQSVKRAHILLALVGEHGSSVARLLRDSGADPERIRIAAIRLLDHEQPTDGPAE